MVEVDGSPLADRIERPGEVDEFALEVKERAAYAVATAPVDVLVGLFDAGGELLARGQGGVTSLLEPGKYSIKVQHRLKKGTGTYSVSCRKAVDVID